MSVKLRWSQRCCASNGAHRASRIRKPCCPKASAGWATRCAKSAASRTRCAPRCSMTCGGFAAALEQLARELDGQDGLEVAFESTRREMPNLPGTVNTVLFRIAQEALNNIARYRLAQYVRTAGYARRNVEPRLAIGPHVDHSKRAAAARRAKDEELARTAMNIILVDRRSTACAPGSKPCRICA